MNRQQRIEKALGICLQALTTKGMGAVVEEAQAIINEPQIKIGEHFYGIAIEDDGCGRIHGEPILHETYLDRSRTIKSAMERAHSCGDRHGKKYLTLITILEEV